MKKTILFLFTTLFLFLPRLVHATDTLIFDSTNNYLGACQLTNKSEWELPNDIEVTTFQVWYNWNEGETSLPVKVFKDGQPFAEFSATRASCDPYQKQWCNADFTINKLLPKGKYSTEIENSRQCLKPGGTGAIRLYQKEVKPEEKSSPNLIATTKPIQNTSAATPACNCKQTTTIVVATVASAITSFLVSFLLKKKG